MNAEVAVLENGQLSVTERDEHLERLRAYAAAMAELLHRTDQASVGRARDLAELYEDRAWVAEMDLIEPRPANAPHNWAPDSGNRFISWCQGTAGIHLATSWLKEMLAGHREISAGRSAAIKNIESIRTLRPIYQLEAKELGGRKPEAYARAAELADGGKITIQHTKQAVAEIIGDTPTVHLRTADRNRASEVNANRALMHFERILDSGDYPAAKHLLETMASLYNDRTSA